MQKFTSINDVNNLSALLANMHSIVQNPLQHISLGTNKTLLLVFFDASLRTRLSTQKAALNLGMNVMVLDINQASWKLETQDGIIMNSDKAEHIKEAIPVMTSYCDIIAVRSFPQLNNKAEDYSEKILQQFISLSTKPVISMESATRHPLQSLADIYTIEQLKTKAKPKVVLTWAPHIKALPQSVPNSFAEWVNATDYELVITHPKGYELDAEFVGNATVEYEQDKAFADADFIYAKNWSCAQEPNYGKILCQDLSWTVTNAKMQLTKQAKFMHCLPVRRNLIVTDQVIESADSIVLAQATNRVYAAQVVLQTMLQKKPI